VELSLHSPNTSS